MTSFNGSEAVNVARLITLGVALSSYASQVERHGSVVMIVTRGATPSALMKMAKAEGFKGKARDYSGAAGYVKDKAYVLRSALPEGAITP